MTRTPGVLRRLAALALAAVCVVALCGRFGAGAQDPGTGNGASTGIVKGGANAWADSMSFQILNAGAGLGWTFGRSTAAYRDITATSQGSAIDVGALEALLGQPRCDGEVPPLLRQEALPPRTIADSAVAGSSKAARVVARIPAVDDLPEGPVVGTQRAEADGRPWASASTDNVPQDFGFFRVEGATTSATTAFSGGVRTAKAVSTAKRIVVLGGQVIFMNPRWEAEARSGADDYEAATFTFDWVYVFGNYLQGADADRDLGLFKGIVETLLRPFGVIVEYPEVVPPVAGEGISISPLGIRMTNAPIGIDLLAPVLNSELLADVRTRTLSEDCRTETVWTVIDAVERALGGAGSINTLVGGATATTDDTDYTFTPVPQDDGATEVTAAPPPPTDDLGTGTTGFDDFGTADFSSDLGTDDFGSDFGTDNLGLDDSGIGTGEELGAESAPTEKISDSGDGEEIASGSDGSGAASNAAAVAVGVLALLGALGLSMGDRLMGLRARRRIS